jgi:hypothetical protein
MSVQIFLSKEGLAIYSIESVGGRGKVLQISKDDKKYTDASVSVFMNEAEAALLLHRLSAWLGVAHYAYVFPSPAGHVFWAAMECPEFYQLCGCKEMSHAV